MRRLRSMATAAMASITAVTVPAASERDTDDASSTQQTAPIRSTAEQRDADAITVYIQYFVLVRVVRTLDLHSGRIALEYGDVASGIQHDTLHLHSVSGVGLQVLEQNYEYDQLS